MTLLIFLSVFQFVLDIGYTLDRIDLENMTVEQLKPLIWRYFISC